MKKLILLFLNILCIFTLISCNEKKEDINTPKEFKTGDTVTYNGVIYEYMDYAKDIAPLSGREALDYVFEEEENYESYYNFYYLDMSDYKNQPSLREDKSIIDFPKDFFGYNCPKSSPITPYAFHVPSNLFVRDNVLSGIFIVKGYTDDLPNDVIIPMQIHGKDVTQIGFKAFDKAPMKTLKTMQVRYVHPYAIHECNNLEDVEMNWSILMSMGISNCEKLEHIKNIRPVMDCSVYNLPNLKEVESIDLFLAESSTMTGNSTVYGMGGIRKSFFYNCPKLEKITGGNFSVTSMVTTAFNTVYLVYKEYEDISIPIYVYDNYTTIVDDVVYTYDGWIYTVMYDPDTLEAYVPFLNDGLEKEGTLLFKHHKQGSEAVTEDETGIYVNFTYNYRDSKYNTKLLFKRK